MGRGIRWLAAGVAVAALWGAAACARGTRGPDRSGAREAVGAWLGAIADGDARRACAQMTASARRQLGADCVVALGRLAGALDADGRDRLRAATVSRLHTEGGLTIATLEAFGTDVGLRRVAGRWVIADLLTSMRSGTAGAFPLGPTATPRAR
jgi:hypothetical protein